MSEPNKKLDTKKIRKHTSFLQLNLCHYALNFYVTSLDLGNVNYPMFIEMLNNFIYNIFVLSLANNITLDKTKILIDDGCLLISDYVVICHEEEFKKNTFNLRIADAIQYGYAKISDKIIASIPTITRHTNFIDSLDANTANHFCNDVDSAISGNILPNNKPSSLPKSLPTILMMNNSQSNTTANTNTIDKPRNLVKNKFGEISQHAHNRMLSIKGINTKCNRIIYLVSGFITHIFNILMRACFFNLKPSTQQQPQYSHGWFMQIWVREITQEVRGGDQEILTDNREFIEKMTYNLDVLESYLNMIYPIIYTIVKHNIYLNLAEYLNDITCLANKCSQLDQQHGDVLVALFIYLRELCQISNNIDRLIIGKALNDIYLFLVTNTTDSLLVISGQETSTSLSASNGNYFSPYKTSNSKLYSKNKISDGISFDNIYKQFNQLD